MLFQDTAASYGVGAVGSLVYLRMLNRSIDSVGGFSVGAAVGQPRLLVPVILTATFNRSVLHKGGHTVYVLVPVILTATYGGSALHKGAPLSMVQHEHLHSSFAFLDPC